MDQKGNKQIINEIKSNIHTAKILINLDLKQGDNDKIQRIMGILSQINFSEVALDHMIQLQYSADNQNDSRSYQSLSCNPPDSNPSSTSSPDKALASNAIFLKQDEFEMIYSIVTDQTEDGRYKLLHELNHYKNQNATLQIQLKQYQNTEQGHYHKLRLLQEENNLLKQNLDKKNKNLNDQNQLLPEFSMNEAPQQQILMQNPIADLNDQNQLLPEFQQNEAPQQQILMQNPIADPESAIQVSYDSVMQGIQRISLVLKDLNDSTKK